MFCSFASSLQGATKISKVRTGNAKKRMSVSPFVITETSLSLAFFKKFCGLYI